MKTLFLLFISVLPIYLIGAFIYKKDKDKEPRKLLVKLFLFGVLSCIPAAILELLYDGVFGEANYINFTQLFIHTFIGIAFVEEICKWFFVYNVSYNHTDFDHPYDAIVYATFVSLGFACFENILYVLVSDNQFSIAVLRAFTSIPGHVGNAIIMGSFLTSAKVASLKGNRAGETWYILLSILAPTITHTIYDFCLMGSSWLLLISFAFFIICIYVFSIRQIKKVSSIPDNFVNNMDK